MQTQMQMKVQQSHAPYHAKAKHGKPSPWRTRFHERADSGTSGWKLEPAATLRAKCPSVRFDGDPWTFERVCAECTAASVHAKLDLSGTYSCRYWAASHICNCCRTYLQASTECAASAQNIYCSRRMRRQHFESAKQATRLFSNESDEDGRCEGAPGQSIPTRHSLSICGDPS